MNTELLQSLEYIEKEKNVSREILLEALRMALISACKKTFPEKENLDVQIDTETGDIRLLENGELIQNADFGRIAAQTAKQVIIQKIREAEREAIHNEYSTKVQDIVNGTVHRIDRRVIIVDLGKTEGILPLREQSHKEHFRQGDPIKIFVVEVNKTARGPEIIVSRSHPNLVRKLFEIEVPEISDNIVQIKAVAREAGARTKIAVTSSDDKIDCVGSCVGMRGQRVKNIVRELQGEKIDIVRYSEDSETFIRNALSPAQLAEVHLNKDNKTANIFVQDDQLSLSIGKKGQNVRLASKLTGWKLEVRSLSQKIPLSELEGVGGKTEELLREAGITTLKDILKSSVEELTKIKGIGAKTAEKIIASAHRVILKEGKTLPVIPELELTPPAEQAVEDQVEAPSGEVVQGEIRPAEIKKKKGKPAAKKKNVKKPRTTKKKTEAAKKEPAVKEEKESEEAAE